MSRVSTSGRGEDERVAEHCEGGRHRCCAKSFLHPSCTVYCKLLKCLIQDTNHTDLRWKLT